MGTSRSCPTPTSTGSHSFARSIDWTCWSDHGLPTTKRARARRTEFPVTSVSSLDDVVNDEKLNRGVITTATHPVVGEYREIAPPVAMSKTPASIRRPAPLVAQDTREILDG